MPALRLAPDDRREPVRADPVPDHPLLRRLPPAVRIDQAGLMAEPAAASSRRRRCPRSSASSVPGRWAPGSARWRSRPAARSSSTTSTRRPSTAGATRIRDGLARRAAKLDLDADTTDDWVEARLDRVRDVPTVDGLADEADLVIESALEDLALKRTIFRTLDEVADPERRSSPPTRARCRSPRSPRRRAGRIASSASTSSTRRRSWPSSRSSRRRSPTPRSSARAVAIVTAWGKTPVVCADRPGFIVNRVNRPFTIEALRILENGRGGRRARSTRRCATAASRWARSSSWT